MAQVRGDRRAEGGKTDLPPVTMAGELQRHPAVGGDSVCIIGFVYQQQDRRTVRDFGQRGIQVLLLLPDVVQSRQPEGLFAK